MRPPGNISPVRITLEMFSAIKSIVIVKVSQETLQRWHMPPQCVFFWMACILDRNRQGVTQQHEKLHVSRPAVFTLFPQP